MKKTKKTAIVTGAGGFIGSHLVKYLKAKNYFVKGIDIKYPEFSKTEADEFVIADLRDSASTRKAITKVDELYMLAADMGGMGFISCHGAQIVHNNAIINLNTLEVAKDRAIKKIFFASSACVYPEEKQLSTSNLVLKETDAYPANPDTDYGWEKLFIEKSAAAYARDYNLEMRIARFHNIYGPEGTYDGGREKAPAAICRKVAQAQKKDDIEVWGDGKQSRSYCFIEDCCEGIYRLMQSDCDQVLNIGSDRLVSVDELVEIVAKIAGKDISKDYDLTKPQGVRGRNSDNTLLKEKLDWEPVISLEDGLKKTYDWISLELSKKNGN